MREKIVVLDFGSQYAHLIAKRFRLMGYYSEIALPNSKLSVFENAKGIVFSGGPSSIYDDKIPEFNDDIFSLDIPILGLCYGHYVVAQNYGGIVNKAPVGEFGFAQLKIKNKKSPLLDEIPDVSQVWMSHQDGIIECPKNFEVIGTTKDCPFAAIQNIEQKRFGLQFHVEVKDTIYGNKIFENFAKFCNMEKNWDQDKVLDIILEQIKTQTKTGLPDEKKVLLFLSGGVDSTVAFALLNKAIGQDRVLGLHIDNGFMRKNESDQIAKRYQKEGFKNFISEDASESFLQAIFKLTDPQLKRKAVGEHFLTVRETVVKKLGLVENQWLLAQGTLYPDIIESGGTANSHTIKTHHNRVDSIQKLISKGLVIEPLKDLYKDEVRNIGKKIGLAEDLVMRHPFPGPGLSINVLCNTGVLSSEEERDLLKAERLLKNISLKSFIKNNVPDISALPVKSVGVQGDFRTYKFPCVLTFSKELPSWDTLDKLSSHITNSVSDVNRTIICLFKNKVCDIQEGYCDKDRLDKTREVDSIVLDELHKTGWYQKIFQHLTINLPYASCRNHCSIVLRPVVSEDVMTARFAHLDNSLLDNIVNKIKQLDFVDALYYDITNKPPATFGWE